MRERRVRGRAAGADCLGTHSHSVERSARHGGPRGAPRQESGQKHGPCTEEPGHYRLYPPELSSGFMFFGSDSGGMDSRRGATVLTRPRELGFGKSLFVEVMLFVFDEAFGIFGYF
ncbi:hypothetical protein WMY93_027081 [Mugilogobius chulae]|uniref:Uncharacterized protein n=1 Tax=Mugilogobius chulae TaxID=88201 RepID=A0AAW0MRY5_9GOBI